ncbi:MAG: type II toxin-antitoxin system MqsA family antitoxin [Candidatus Hydrogenedentes bacterium]|nr:type II toxin-antitoxin system MqsA family antitoxin [Candidatus Hydrogenedentota bacterium]
MKCVICRNGQTRPGPALVTLQRGGSVVIIKGVPAEVCDNCGEYYLDEKVTAEVLAVAESAVQHGAEVEIIRYAA